MMSRDPNRRTTTIRTAGPEDLDAVLAVERAAFGGETEAGLVRSLVADPTAFVDGLSLVADDDGTVVGHVLFTQATCIGGEPAVLLAPLAVAPAHQRSGVGSALVRAGLARAQELGFGVALVLGDPAYYTRFEFEPAYRSGILPPYPVEPADAWMALELSPGALGRAPGTPKLAAAFGDPALWKE